MSDSPSKTRYGRVPKQTKTLAQEIAKQPTPSLAKSKRTSSTPNKPGRKKGSTTQSAVSAVIPSSKAAKSVPVEEGVQYEELFSDDEDDEEEEEEEEEDEEDDEEEVWSADEDSEYEPCAEDIKTIASKSGKNTPRTRTPRRASLATKNTTNGKNDSAGIFDEEDNERDIYDFDAQSIVSEQDKRKKKRGSTSAPVSVQSTPSQVKSGKNNAASWGSNIYSSIATALKSRPDLDNYTGFLKATFKNDSLDNLYSEICKPSAAHSAVFFGPSAALQSMMSRINNHDKVVDILRSCMSRSHDLQAHRIRYLVPIVQQPLLSLDYLPKFVAGAGAAIDSELHVEAGYTLDSDVNLLTGKFDLSYKSGDIPTIVTSDAFHEALRHVLTSDNANDTRLVVVLTPSKQIVAFSLVSTELRAGIPGAASASTYQEGHTSKAASLITETQEDVLSEAVQDGSSFVEPQILPHWAQRVSDLDTCGSLIVQDGLLLKPNGKRDVLLVITGDRHDLQIFALIDEHRFMYQRFGFAKDIPISLDGMFTTYPEDLLEERGLLVVPDATFKSFRKLLMKSVNAQNTTSSSKFVLLDRDKKTPLSVVITSNSFLEMELEKDKEGGAIKCNLQLAGINGLIYALHIDEQRFVTRAMEILPQKHYARLTNSKQPAPTLANFWSLQPCQLDVKFTLETDVQNFAATFHSKFDVKEQQHVLSRFVEDFRKRVLKMPVLVSLYDQVFRMAQANTPEIVEVPIGEGQQMEQWGVCSVCAKELKAFNSLFDHEMRHLGITKYRCTAHDLVFADRKSYRLHMDEEHDDHGDGEDEDDEALQMDSSVNNLQRTVEVLGCERCHDFFPSTALHNAHSEVCDGVSFRDRTPLNKGLDPNQTDATQQSATGGRGKALQFTTCGMCGYTLSTRDKMRRHFLTVHLQCVLCQVPADTLEQLSSHCSKVHISGSSASRKILTCTVCHEFCGTKHNYYFHQWMEHSVLHSAVSKPEEGSGAAESSSSGQMRRPKVRVHKDELSYQATGQKKFHCKFCSAEVRVTGNEYTKHLLLKHGLNVDQASTCRVCAELFESTDRLSEHLSEHHVPGGEFANAGIQTIYRCDKCPFFSFSQGIREHARNIHQDEDPAIYECQHCMERFRDRKLWRTHLDKHSEALNHVCDICQRPFRVRQSLLQHIRNHHSDDDGPCNCEYCGQIYPKRSSLRHHIYRMHTEHGQEMRFNCQLCDRRFRLETELRRHMKEMHSGQMECDICQKLCPNLRCFTQHRLKHFRTRIYQCTDCQATFKSKLAMKRHIRVEHLKLGPEKFECQICGKVVTQIAMHMLTHKDARYECEFCDKKFTKSAYYNEHIRIHKGEKPFECHICCKRFNKKSNLNVHIKYHEKHRDEDGNYVEIKPRGRLECDNDLEGNNSAAGINTGGRPRRTVTMISVACDTWADAPNRIEKLALVENLSIITDTDDLELFVANDGVLPGFEPFVRRPIAINNGFVIKQDTTAELTDLTDFANEGLAAAMASFTNGVAEVYGMPPAAKRFKTEPGTLQE